MRVPREYMTYLSRVLSEKLVAGGLISTTDSVRLTAAIHHAMETEFAVEDRINEEARSILAQHSDQMQQLGAAYGDAFKKIKAELVRQQKVVL